MTPLHITLPNGHKTRLLDTGGPDSTLVLVHGLGNSLEIWDRVLPQLAQSFRVIAFDLPGFGEASRPDAAYDGPFFAAQIVALLDALGIKRTTLVGNSLGASAILHMSAIAPHRIERAVLAAPGGIGQRTNILMRAAALPLIGGWLARPTPANNRITLKLALHDHKHLTADLVAAFERYGSRPNSTRAFVRSLQTGVTLRGSRDSAQIRALAAAFQPPRSSCGGGRTGCFPCSTPKRPRSLFPTRS